MEKIKRIDQVSAENVEDAKRSFVYYADKFYEQGLTAEEITEICSLGHGILNYNSSVKKSKGENVLGKRRSKLKEIFQSAKKSELVTFVELCEVMADVIGSTVEYDYSKLVSMSREELQVMQAKANDIIGFCKILLIELGEISKASSSNDIRKFNTYQMDIYRNQELIKNIDKILSGDGNVKEPEANQRG